MDNDELFSAARRDDRAAIQQALAERPERVNERNLGASDKDGTWDELTPIHSAAKHGHLELVKFLVESGAEVYSNPMASYPAVMLASWAGRQSVVDYFLREIPDKAQGTFGVGVTCNLAGRQGWIEQVRMHLDQDRLAVHQRGWIGDTPLHWPAHNGHIEIVRLLLEHGADPNAHEINCYGGSPLHWASERHADIVRLLLANGADPNARVSLAKSDLNGATPLIWCARQRDDAGDVAAILLQVGADPNVKDAGGKTARDHARERGNTAILAALDA